VTKTTKKHFKLFKKAVKHYCKRYGIRGWNIYHEVSCLENSHASVNASYNDRCAKFFFPEEWPDNDRVLNEKNIYWAAKHEVAHLLIWPLYAIGFDRFSTKVELEAVNEELAIRLTEILR